MDLPYPSRKDVALDSQLNKIDKIYSKIMLSVKDLKQDESKSLSKSTKDKIQKFIQQDNINKLEKYLQKYVIFYDRQIGAKSTKWNVIHYCAKYNSVNSLKFILCKIYQQDKEQYKKLINQKTFEGYTPLMITVINNSNQAMQILLHYGGIDIYQIDSKKMTAYEMSLNYNNQEAIRCLIEYEKRYKKKVSINQKQLLKPLQLKSILQMSYYQSLIECVINCFICFKTQEIEQKNQDNNNQSRKSRIKSFIIQPNSTIKQNNPNDNFIMKNMKNLNNSILKNLWGGLNEQKIDKIMIGRQDLISQYDICWKKISQLNNQKNSLFDSFQPFDICQNNFVIFNNLIIFQCLSDHTWLLRKIIKLNNSEEKNKNRLNSNSNGNNQVIQYVVNIYENNALKRIVVDQFIPFLKQRQQPMFLSNFNQTWPMVLQKALAKYYGSYMNLADVPSFKIVQQLTGFLTKKFQLSQNSNNFRIGQSQKIFKQKSIISILQEFTTKDYLILLQGRQGTSLSPKQKTKTPYCYTILNYFQKGDKKLILINCPYVLEHWKQKQKTQMMQLKLIKSHYNKHNQMCVWIQQNQFCYFFKSVIVSFIEPNYTRTELKFKIQSNQNMSQFFKNISNLDLNSNLIPNSQISIKNQSQIQTQRSLIKSSKQKVYLEEFKQRQRVSQKSSNLQQKKTSTSTIFIKFKIQKQKSEPIILMVKNINKAIQTKMINYQGWINQGHQKTQIFHNQKGCAQAFTPQLIKLISKRGEYLLKIQFQSCLKSFSRKSRRQSSSSCNKENSLTTINKNVNAQNQVNYNQRQRFSPKNNTFIKDSSEKEISKKKQSNLLQKSNEFMIFCWSQEIIQLQFIQQEFAKLEWIQSWKRYMIKTWPDKSNFMTLSLLDKSVILTKCNSKTEKRLFLKFINNGLEQIQAANLLEGRFIQIRDQKVDQLQLWVQMIQQENRPNFFYTIFTQLNQELMQKQKQKQKLIFQIYKEEEIQRQKLKLLLQRQP